MKPQKPHAHCEALHINIKIFLTGHTREIAQQTINDLMSSEWLAPETRAVIIEFVIYNSNVNLFAVSSMTFEFLPTGSEYWSRACKCS